MSFLNIKEKFSKRILESEKDKAEKSDESSTKSSYFVAASLKETEVGIAEYVSDLPGFHGIIKQRFSDFNVHEIDMEGNMATLDSFVIPNETFQSDVSDCSFLDDKTLEDLENLVASDSSVESVLIEVTQRSKEERTAIHQYIKGKYGTSVVSGTSDEDGKKMITVRKSTNTKKDERRPGHLPKFLHFILSKSNTDTNEALSVIGTKLRIKVNNFNIAGTKDKRGNTSQWVSIKNLCASKLAPLNKSLRKMRVGNFCYKPYALSLGNLKGNNFQIALRNISASDSDIQDAMQKLKDFGFINYFGLQRFGNSAECPTHEIGRQLLKESYSAAIHLILKPRSGRERTDLHQAREIWAATRDAGRALFALRTRDRSIEAQILRALKQHGSNAFINALDSIPRNIVLLYLHAYQSMLWNRIVSKRITKHRLKVLVGDLVLDGAVTENSTSAEIAIAKREEGDVAENGDVAVNGDVTENDDVAEDGDKKPCRVKEVTEENIAFYNIHDVLLPIPGNDIIYPKNEVGDWYEEILAEEGLTSEIWSSRIRKYSLPGSYRKILGLPGNMSWRIEKYSNPDDDLIMSDIDIVDNKHIPDRPEGTMRALIINFDLDRSTYATMALREILRMDTSASVQAELNAPLKRDGDIIYDDSKPAKRSKDDLDENGVSEN